MYSSKRSVVTDVAVVILFLVFLGYLFAGMRETGPNCPYKDPSWVGFCDETP